MTIKSERLIGRIKDSDARAQPQEKIERTLEMTERNENKTKFRPLKVPSANPRTYTFSVP